MSYIHQANHMGLNFDLTKFWTILMHFERYISRAFSNCHHYQGAFIIIHVVILLLCAWRAYHQAHLHTAEVNTQQQYLTCSYIII